ncbi:MAG: ATP-dependent Clp protease proteolytic subunit [Brevundimonas sp.]|nr:ATP-dependent Clp protease proteolytic subunit [Brevundimonas sp.]
MSEPPSELLTPQVRLYGEVGDTMLAAFLDQMDKARAGPGPIVVELTTPGGDADVGRRIAAEIRLMRERTGRAPLFFGKTAVYSAGATIMAGFRREDRWMDRQAVLMIHCRKLAKTLELSNFLADERPRVEALLAEIDLGLKVQTWDFEALIEGSDVQLEELERCARENWYIDASEALKRGLIAGVV